MSRLSLLINEFSEIQEIEINPLIIEHSQMSAVDLKVITISKPKGPAFKTAKVVEHKVLAGSFNYFVLETKDPFVAKPGQFISVKVAVTRINSYSIAGVIGENKIELLIDTAPNGPGSIFFNGLKAGAEVSFLGPFGNFELKEDGTEKQIFMATGSGIAPFRFMVKELLEKQNSQKEITLYFGLRHQSDIFWWEEFDKLALTYPNFTFRLCLSQPDDDWTGDRGHITELVAKDFPNCDNISAYMCGGKAMINEAQEILKQNNCQPVHIYFEKFD
jgi:NAD(P)H-flavin reductase